MKRAKLGLLEVLGLVENPWGGKVNLQKNKHFWSPKE
jgi:hypothetical protein